MNIDCFPNQSIIRELLFFEKTTVWDMFAVMTVTKTFFLLMFKVGHDVIKMLATFIILGCRYPVIFILTFNVGHYVKIIMLANFY